MVKNIMTNSINKIGNLDSNAAILDDKNIVNISLIGIMIYFVSTKFINRYFSQCWFLFLLGKSDFLGFND